MKRRPVRVHRGNSTVLGHGGRSAWVGRWWAGNVPRGHYGASWRGARVTPYGDGTGYLTVPCTPLADEAWYRVRPIDRLGPRYPKRIGRAWWWMPVEARP